MGSIKLNLTESNLKNSIDVSIDRINDLKIAGFHARIGKPDSEGNRSIILYYFYRFDGKQYNQKLCKFIPKLNKDSVDTLATARQQVRELQQLIDKGKNPKTEQEKAKEVRKEEREAPDVNSLIDDFIDIYLTPNRKRPEEAITSFNNDVRPSIGEVKLKALTTEKVIKTCLDPINKRGSHVQANKTLSLLKQLFQFGVERGALNSNPLQATKRKSIGGLEKPRERNLSFEEIGIFLNKLKISNASVQVKSALKLLLLTGCRTEEMLKAEWTHIDLKSKLWLFPATNRKGKKGATKEHIVPITQMIEDELLHLKSTFSILNSNYVFTSSYGDKPISEKACSKFLRRQFKNNDLSKHIEPFVPHDLRRTLCSRMAELGIDVIITEKVVGHELQGMLKVYNRYDYLEERREALHKWHLHIANHCE